MQIPLTFPRDVGIFSADKNVASEPRGAAPAAQGGEVRVALLVSEENAVVGPRVTAFVMAGGEGTRLRPFTRDCPKPALPFARRYRIIDFVLSNLYNSMIRSVYVLLQYRPESLLKHLAENWGFARSAPGELLEAVLPRGDGPRGGFKGTADAVRQNLHLVEAGRPDAVAVFAADHVYRMDVRQMLAFHEARAADATVAAVPVPVGEASAFGVICADTAGRILGFQEKPDAPAPMPGKPGYAFASMGNYLFRPEVLREVLEAAAARGEYDFGQHVLPRMIGTHRVYAYDFSRNLIPGVKPHEERAYWRDVGTVEAYRSAHRDLRGPQPRFSLDNAEWPIYPGERPGTAAARRRGVISRAVRGAGVGAQGAALRPRRGRSGAPVYMAAQPVGRDAPSVAEQAREVSGN